MYLYHYYLMLFYGYLLADFIRTTMVPIIKKGYTSDKNNYRPIALVTAAVVCNLYC